MKTHELADRLLDAVDTLKAIPGRTIYQGAHQPLRAYRDELVSWKADTTQFILEHLGRDAAKAFDAVANPSVPGVTTQLLDDVIATYEQYLRDVAARIRSTDAAGATTSEAGPLPAFCSYSSKDDAHRERLRVALAVLERQGLLKMWEFRTLEAGTEWDSEIRKHLHAAKLIFLLVSPDFFNSRYTIEEELRTALERHAAGTARVVPIIVRPCDWRETDLRHLQALPRDGKSVSEWSNVDAAWQNVTEGIRQAIRSLAAIHTTAPAPTTAASLTIAQRDVLLTFMRRGCRAGEGLPINVFVGDRDAREAIDALLAMDLLRAGKNNYVLLTERAYDVAKTLHAGSDARR